MNAALPDPLRVLHVISSTGVGGAERMLARTLKALMLHDRPRVECLTVSVKPLGAVAQLLVREGHDVTSLEAERPGGLMSRIALPLTETTAILRLRGEIRDFRPHVVQTWLPRAGILGRIAAIGAGAAVLGSVRVTEPRRNWQVVLDGLTRALVDRWLAVSEAGADFQSREAGIPRERFTVIPNALEDSDLIVPEAARTFRARHGIPAGAFLIVTMGRLHEQKAQADLLRALARAADEEMHVVIAGEGPEEASLRSLARGLGVSERLHLLGVLADPRELLGAADVFALPSNFEGMPGALLEAMGLGLASVATDIPGVSELARHEIETLLVPSSDPAALCTAILRLRDDAALRARLGAAARERVRASFLMPRNIERLLELYASVL